MIRTMGFPGRYVQGPNALSGLGELIRELKFRKPVTLCDAVVAERVWPDVARSLQKADFTPGKVDFPGECTSSVIAAMSQQIAIDAPDVVIGLGGGKAIDTAKGVSLALGIPIIVCPTIASNDAPTSRLIVRYTEDHRIAGVDQIPSNPAAVVVDSSVIVQAPARFFAAGIGDAISKKFEVGQCQRSGGLNFFGTPALNTAMLLADSMHATLMKHGIAAYESVRAGRLNDSVEAVIEATVLLSGVSFESGGLSLAHALIRGLTSMPNMAAMLHGDLVAFGTLVQVVYEQRPQDEMAELIALLNGVDLPITLAQLGQLEPLTEQDMNVIVEATLAAKYSRNMKPALTAPLLAAAIRQADAIGQAASSKNHR